MKIQVLEYGQAPSDSPKHSIPGGKARVLVEELRWAERIGKRLIKLTIDRSWSAIKLWLSRSEDQRRASERRAESLADCAKIAQARAIFPDGAQFGYAVWPCKDLRTVVG
jgi:hypothetical protein